MTKIALLCPSRSRPQQYKRMFDSVAKTTNCTWHSLLAVSEEDAPNYHQEEWSRLIVPEGMPTVHKWNMLAHKAMEFPDVKLFMLAADDIIFYTPGWDEAIIEHYESLTNKIHCYALQDSRDKDGTPHFLVTREWIDAMGYAFMPIFNHFFVDTWTVAIAKANNVFTHMRDYLLVHDKSNDRGAPDTTHLRIRQNGTHARDKYVNDTCEPMLEGEIARLKHILDPFGHAENDE